MDVRISVRSGEPPDDATVLLHFGEGSSRSVRRIADEVIDRHDYWRGVLDPRGRFAVSVYTLDGIAESEIARSMPHAMYGRSTVRAVREAGFDLVRSTVDFDRMPVNLRKIQPWHSTIFLRLEGLTIPVSEQVAPANSLVEAVRLELQQLFVLFARIENRYNET